MHLYLSGRFFSSSSPSHPLWGKGETGVLIFRLVYPRLFIFRGRSDLATCTRGRWWKRWLKKSCLGKKRGGGGGRSPLWQGMRKRGEGILLVPLFRSHCPIVEVNKVVIAEATKQNSFGSHTRKDRGKKPRKPFLSPPSQRPSLSVLFFYVSARVFLWILRGFSEEKRPVFPPFSWRAIKMES